MRLTRLGTMLPRTVHSFIFLMPMSSGKKVKSRLTLNHPCTNKVYAEHFKTM
jgi:hypothetical protein